MSDKPVRIAVDADSLMKVSSEVVHERIVQIINYGWTQEHDDRQGVHHVMYLALNRLSVQQVEQHPDREELIKVAALIIAAVEVIDRTSA